MYKIWETLCGHLHHIACTHQQKQLVPNKGIYPRKSLLVELSEKVRPGQTRGLK